MQSEAGSVLSTTLTGSSRTEVVPDNHTQKNVLILPNPEFTMSRDVCSRDATTEPSLASVAALAELNIDDLLYAPIHTLRHLPEAPVGKLCSKVRGPSCHLEKEDPNLGEGPESIQKNTTRKACVSKKSKTHKL